MSVRGPLRYAGGKSRAVNRLAAALPRNLRRLVSPFFGGGSLEIAVAGAGIPVVGYDVFDVLVNYWRVQLTAPEQLAWRLRRWDSGPETYGAVRARLAEHWSGGRRIEGEVELAAHYFHNHSLSYGPGFLGWRSRNYDDPSRYRRMVDRVESFRCARLSVECAGFDHSVPRHRDDFLYIDPPYYLGGDSEVFAGMYPRRGLAVHHDGFDHVGLREVLAGHRGGFLLSYNDCSAVRDLYEGCEITEAEWVHTMGQGETRGDRSTKTKRGRELLIRS